MRALAVPPDVNTARSVKACDQFFETLDGQTLRVGGAHWRLVVFAVRVEGGRRWLQVGLRGPRFRALCLNLALDRSPADVLEVLRAALDGDEGSSGDTVVQTLILD